MEVKADGESPDRAVAAATVSMLPGANMRFAIVAIDLAHGWDDLLEAFKLHVSPTNLHYADVDGNIAWHAIGFTPRRKGHDGLFPVPGDGRYDWDGLVQLDEMPSIVNPEQGWIASANAYNVPASYPIKEKPLGLTGKRKGIAMMKTWPVGAWLGTRKAKERVVTAFRAAKPLNGWLARNVG